MPLAGMEMRGWRPNQVCELDALCLTLVCFTRTCRSLPIRDQCATCVTDAP